MDKYNLEKYCNQEVDTPFLVKQIIYSLDNQKRFILLEEGKNMYSYKLEFLTKINEENNEYKWMSPCCSMSHSLFISLLDALNDLKLTEEYNKYFIK